MNANATPLARQPDGNRPRRLEYRSIIIAVLSVAATIAIAAWRDRVGVEGRVSANVQQITELERRMAALEARHEELMKAAYESARQNSEHYTQIYTRLALIEQLLRRRDPPMRAP